MSNFTQLDLNGNTNSKQAPKSAPSTKPMPGKLNNKSQHGGTKAAVIVGSFMAATLIATFTIGTNGCSKSKTTAVSNPAPAMTQPAAPAVTPAPTPSPAPVAKVAKKSPRQHKLATFKSKDYGLSFRYPKYYTMNEGEETDPTQANVASAAMNFTQPGGVTLSSIELPEKLYPKTDFDSAFFTVNVNPKMTADECNQFAFPEKSDLDNLSNGPSTVNVAGTDFTEMDDVVSDGTLQANARYYHLYQNNVCYEFALGLQTAAEETNKNLKPVNRDRVFDKLQWMLATVKIKPVSATTEAAASSTTSPAAAAPAITAATTTTPAIEPSDPNNQ
jgi:hypothetical protein